MQAHRRWLGPLGLFLMLPLAGVLALSAAWAVAGVGCNVECGDAGRGLFVMLLLCTPPAAVGLLALTPNRARGRRPGLVRIADRVAIGMVGFCALVLVGVAIAAAVGAVNRLADGPERYAGREGVFMLVVAVVLGAMAVATLLALRAAWRKRRAG